MRFRGKLYRALNPIFADAPLSGRGAELHGGRFNPKGIPAIYASLDVLTALREANQVGNLQPTTLVSYDADIERVADCRDEAFLVDRDMDADRLAAATWRDELRRGREARTQAFGRKLAADGFDAMLVRSFAPGLSDTNLNLVLWRWGGAPPSHLTLIDDQNRLAPRRR